MEEIEALLAVREARMPCKKNFIEDIGYVYPELVSVLAQSYAEADADLAKLMNKEMSVGAYNKHIIDRSIKFLRQFERAQRQKYGSLQKSYEYEVAQRNLAIRNLQNWLFQQQVLYQQQQLINSLSRPNITNCEYFRATIQCTSW